LLSAGEHEVTITLTPQADDVSAMGALFEVQNANTGAPVTFPSRAN
jgi:hypothetical protein